MRSLLFFILLMVSNLAMASVFPDAKDVKEEKSNRPGVFKFRVTEDKSGGGQAANYAQPNLTDLYQRLLKENKGFGRLVKRIYNSYECDTDGRFQDPKLKDEGYCGELSGVEDSNTVLWSYRRGGWMDASSVRKSFLTWQSAGTGNLTDVVIELTTKVSVVAPESANLEGKPAVFDVTIDMTNFREVKH